MFVVGRLASATAWLGQAEEATASRRCCPPPLARPTRRAAVEGFEDLFAPGNIVDLAGP